MGVDEPIHLPFYRFGSAYKGASDLADVPREDILRFVYHKRYLIRTQAAKALRLVGAFDEIEKLLRDASPLVRRAALDGMADYRYWFHVGKNPMKPDQFTPPMLAAIRSMLNDPGEALYVIDGALMALSLAPPADIGESLSLVMPWTTHEEWWLRQSAFRALSTMANDAALLPRVLPTMMDMMTDEDHTQPRQGMVRALSRILNKHKKDSLAGKQVIGAFLKAARTREIAAGPRSGEGEYDVSEAVNVLLKKAPENSLETARLMKSRLAVLTTGMISGVSRGLRDSLDKVPPDHRNALEELLYTDYRSTLIARMETEGANLGLLETIGSLTSLRQEIVGWKALGRIAPGIRTWRFTSFEPGEKDALHPRIGKRFRDVALPDGLEGWQAPAFDDAKWATGNAPIGKGLFKHKRSETVFENKSTWGSGEFLLMRTTFELDSLDYDYYRISVLANQGYHIYLNGHKIQTYIWWKDQPHYRTIMISAENVKHFKKGANSLAAYVNSRYVDDKLMGQIDLYLEGMKTSDVLGGTE
jgi:hypothetical protein